MKKLTAGILTVMLGIVAANSADASIASKGYVDAQVKTSVSNTTFESFKTENTAAIEAAKQAGTDANAALETYKTANNAAVAAKADSATVTAELAKKQDKLTAGTNIEIGTDGTISSTYTYDDAGVKADITKNANAISAMDTAYKAADTAINNKIGTVAEGKTVVEMIADAKNAASGDTTALQTRVKTIEDSDVMASGATKAKIDAIATNTAGVAENKAAVAAVTKDLADNYTKTADLGTLAKAAPGECAEPTKKCALVFDGTKYTWEVIERDAENK